jgi:hypothetical protein
MAMADNVVTNPGSGGATFATDDIGGIQWPFSKLAFGPRDTATEVQDADGKRLPVTVDPDLMTTAVMLLSMILEKLPRVDANDRLIINGSEIAPATTPVSVSSGSLSSIGQVDFVRFFGTGGVTQRVADAVPLHLSNSGAQHLYNQIVVT